MDLIFDGRKSNAIDVISKTMNRWRITSGHILPYLGVDVNQEQ